MHKVIKGWSHFQAAWFADIELLEQVYRVTHDSAGMVHALEGPVVNVSSRSKRKSSMPNLADDHYSVVMQPVGLRGADAMPQNEAQLARAAHGCLHGLQALHQVTLWIHLVLLSSCGPITSVAECLVVYLCPRLCQSWWNHTCFSCRPVQCFDTRYAIYPHLPRNVSP